MTRKRRPRLAASLTAWPCVVVGVDPGETTGWAALSCGELIDRGWFEADHEMPEAVLTMALHRAGNLPLVLVGERWGTHFRGGLTLGGLEAAWKPWLWAARKLGVPKRRVLRVNIATWRAAFGLHGLPTEVAKKQALAIAAFRFGLPNLSDHNEAEAILIAAWAAKAGEVGAVLPKRRRRAA